MDKKEIMAREILAFQLFAEDTRQSPDVEADWRSDEGTRVQYKGKADALLRELEDAGVKVSVSATKRAETFLTDLITVPAQKAYDPFEGAGI